MHYKNLVELHRRQSQELGPRPALRFKRQGLYHDLTWNEYRDAALACAAALVEAGIHPGDRIGLLAENSIEWLISDMAILTAGAINVAPHASLTTRQVLFQFKNAGVRWLFASSLEQLAKVEPILDNLPEVCGAVLFDGHLEGRHSSVDKALSWDSFLASGRRALPGLRSELARREESLDADSLATIMYTSGTTGDPKGVMLTHGNLLSNAEACSQVCSFPPGSVAFNWLPLSHIYARLVDHYQTTYIGAILCLAPCPDTLVEELAQVRPTHMASVPRFYEKLLAAVRGEDPEATHKKLRDVFGPQIVWLSSGGAPLPLAIAESYLAAGLPLFEGYGLTESSPVISFNRPGQNKPGTVGPPIPGVEIAVAPDGEILTRGPHVMKGYWNNPGATKEVFIDGWLHTGDMGEIDGDGFLKITGRKKEIMVLSNGRKVVPSFLEGLILADECFDQVVICGEGRHFLTALIVPHWPNLRRALQEKIPGLNHVSEEDLARHPAVSLFLQERIEAAMRDVSVWERVRKFIVLPRPFTVADEELTVSLKLRRKFILARYADRLEALYRDERV
jgi:long-chain acyl-CoA synthetase